MVHWPGDPAFQIRRVSDQKNGDVCTVSQIEMSTHTGTHMDAPLHFLRDAATIDQMPVDATIGPARVIAIRNLKSIGRAELLEHGIRAGERILFKTANSDTRWNSDEFAEDFIFIAKDGAQYLAECGIKTVGVDYLSVGGFRQDIVETHEAILGAGIWIIEGLDLREVSPGDYELVCLPLKLMGSDGSPARAVVRRLPQ
jgi:arylformamidase